MRGTLAAGPGRLQVATSSTSRPTFPHPRRSHRGQRVRTRGASKGSPHRPVVAGATEAALKASEQLRDAGFLVVAIRPPTVPAGTARLRFAFTAQHPEAEIERLANAVRKILPRGMDGHLTTGDESRLAGALTR